MARRSQKTSTGILEKTPTGINGFDEITDGGLPSHRPTLICGDAGAGKTLFSMEFIARGALRSICYYTRNWQPVTRSLLFQHW